jgi:hypothetical protein
MHSNVYPEPEDIVVKYFDIHEQVIEEGGDLTNASRRIYSEYIYMAMLSPNILLQILNKTRKKMMIYRLV